MNVMFAWDLSENFGYCAVSGIYGHRLVQIQAILWQWSFLKSAEGKVILKAVGFY